tara:strand:+ start:1289 stop:2461 length:1173 start_codon:yes stop_codon:yes gene_type:complete
MGNEDSDFKSRISSLKGLFLIGSSDIIGSAISAIFWLLVASLLLVEEYGQITYFLAIASLAQSVSIIGSPNTLMVYGSKQPQSIQTLLFLSILASLIISVIIFLITLKIEIVFLIFAFLFLELSTSVLLGKKLYSIYSKFILIQKSTQFVLGIGLFYIIGFDGIIIGICLSSLPFLYIISKEFRNFKFNFTFLKLKKNFITNNYVVFLISVFRRDIDKIIIVPLLGLTVLGNFALSLQVYTILMVISSISYKYLVPEDATGQRNKKLKKFLILISIFIAIISYFISPIFIETFFSKYEESIIAVQIISLTVIPGTIGLILFSKILSLEKSKYLLIATSIQLCFIIIGIFSLGSMFGTLGIAISFLTAQIAYTISLAIINYNLIGEKRFDI